MSSFYSGIAQYTSTTSVKTPLGAIVPDVGIFTGTDWNYNQSQLDVLAADLLRDYGATMIGNPTKTYNCHAYTWHMTEGGSPVWIGLITVTAHNIYWHPTNGGYVACNENEATKVDYDTDGSSNPFTAGNHSAVRISSNTYQSKWGNGPLVEHFPNGVDDVYKASNTKTYYKIAYMVSFNLNGASGMPPPPQGVGSGGYASAPTPDHTDGLYFRRMVSYEFLCRFSC